MLPLLFIDRRVNCGHRIKKSCAITDDQWLAGHDQYYWSYFLAFGLTIEPDCHSINIRVKLDVEIVPKMPFSATAYFIIVITLQALLTGVYLASFLVCLRWLIFSDDGGTLRKGINWPFLIITVILFAFSATDLGFSLKAILLFSQDTSFTTSALIYGTVITVRNMLIQEMNHRRAELSSI